MFNALRRNKVLRTDARVELFAGDRGGAAQIDPRKSLRALSVQTPESLAIECKLLENSGLFDAYWYRATAGIEAAVGAAEHYLTIGWRQGLEPGPEFEGRFLYPYYVSAGFAGPPALTYMRLRAAGWPVYATRAQAETIAASLRASSLFDARGYAARLGDPGDLDPALHYIIVGERMGLIPSDGFDPRYYADRYPDIAPDAANYLGHYLAYGRMEGRRAVSIAATRTFDRSRLKPDRETILLISHEATRTGAPILAYNIINRLCHRYNVVTVLLAGGELVENFENCCAAVVGPLTEADMHPVEIKYFVKCILAAYPSRYAIVSSIMSWMVVPLLARAFIPVVLLVHEFAGVIRPKSGVRDSLDWATEIVFSADLVARAAQEEHPRSMRRPFHILAQGRCDLPPTLGTASRPNTVRDLHQAFRPPGAENAVVVLGCGSVNLRKGVDIFLSCAAAVAAMRPQRPVRFVWIGRGYDPENDAIYSCYLADQILRSGLKEAVAIIDDMPDLDPVYAMTDLFFLSSRLDPLPNVTIDAALRGLPVICFEGTTGMADILSSDASARQCVVPYLDVPAAAGIIAELANDEPKRLQIGNAIREVSQTIFDMDRYVHRLDELGEEAAGIIHQQARDLATLREDPLFDADSYLPSGAARMTRTEAIVDFITRWAVVGRRLGRKSDYFLRRPCAGFHPQIYAHERAAIYDAAVVNPLAHFIRSGKPDGPWVHDVITPVSPRRGTTKGDGFTAALHAHFHYPELAEDLVSKIAVNVSRCDLLLSTDDDGKANILRKATERYRQGEVVVRLGPNRGRDVGPFLTAFGEDILARYDIVGHVHGKRSLFARASSDPELGERWREFLWQNLIGGLHPMIDVIIGRFAADGELGLVFADDPHLNDWDGNREVAEALAARMSLKEPLPPFFDFPVGSMFWARTAALKPLFDLKLGWDDYPKEPIANDGTLLHALERLFPFVARAAGYRYAATQVPGMTR
jgi:glycosyltransferase involved in cell wall biosynthesis